MTKEEYNRRHINQTQRHGLAMLMKTPEMLTEAVADLGDKISGYKYVKRDLAQAVSAVKRLEQHAGEMCDPTVIEHTRAQTMGRKLIMQYATQQAIKREDALVVPFGDMEQFVDMLLKNDCALCIKHGNEVTACKTHKLLDKYAYLQNPKDNFHECAYLMGEFESDER